MPENPVYDPNKIVSRGYDKGESSVQGDVTTSAPKYDPNKIVSKGYVPKDTVVKEGFTPGDVTGGDDELEKRLDFIQKDSKRTMRDDEKDILRDMYKNPNATKADLTDAILTLQGKKPKQPSENVTGVQYYMDKDERGIYKPIALGFGEKPPPGKQVNSIFGTQKSANDDNWYTDLAKTAYNILPSSAENVIDFFQAGTELATGEQSEYLQSLKNSANALKFSKDEDLQRSIYNSEGVKEWGDLISKDRLDLSPEAAWGTINGALGSVGEFLIPASAISKGFKLGAKPTAFIASYLTNLGEGLDAADEAGLTGRDRSAFAMSVTLPLAAIDAKFDVGSKILSNKMANEAKQDLIKGLGKKVVKDELGNITEQSLKEVSKEAVAAYSPLASSFVKVLTKDVLEEGGEEALQSFVSTAGQQLYDKLTPEDKVKFGADAFSVQSFGKYLSEGIAGAVGGVPLSAVSAMGKRKADYKAQSNAVYDAVKDGDEGVKALKTNITNAFEKGEINKQDYDNAMFKVDAYDSYNKVSSDLTLDDANKKKLFELSLQKENLTASIKAAEAKDKKGKSRLDEMKPPELAMHNSKVEQAKKIQQDIDLIVTKSEIMQQPEVSESVIDKVVKEEEKAAAAPKERVKGEPKSEIGELLGRYGQIKVKESKLEEMVPNGQKYTPPKKVTDETRTMKDFSTQEFNEADFTIKQHKFADALDEIPEKTTVGTLQEDNKFKKENGEVVQTFNLTLDNGKSIRYASSKVRYPEENAVGGFRGNTYEENLTNRENPIGQKIGATVRTLKDSGRKVIFFWNADEGPKFGKHVGMAKETKEGKSVYSQADIDEMADLRMMNMGQNPTGPATNIINPEGPINEGPVKEKPTKKSPKKSNPSSVTRDVRQELLGLKYTKADIQNMTVKEAYDIANEKRSKVAKQESKEVEVSDKKKIAEYRNKEQEELKEAGINLEDYPGTYGNEQGNMPDDLYAKYKPIYDKYNKLITEASKDKPTTDTKVDIEKKSIVADIITTQLELGVDLPKILETLVKQGHVIKNNNSALFDLGGGRDAMLFNIDGVIIPIYRSSQGTSSKTKGNWYPFFFNTTDWLVKGMSDSYKDGYNNPIIKQILNSLNTNYKYDKAKSSVNVNNRELLNNFTTKEFNFDNNGIYDFQNYYAAASILKYWQDNLGTIDVKGYEGYVDNIISNLKKTNPKLSKDIDDSFNDVKKIFKSIEDAESNALESKPAEKDTSKRDLRETQLKEKKDAKEIANRQKQAAKEEKIKQIKEKKESILRSTRAIKTLINRYNDLLLKDKKSEQGLALLKNIKEKVEAIGYNLKLRDKSNLSLLDENNKLVYATPVKRSDDEKAYEAEKKRALKASPTSVQHAVILDVANGKQFDVENLRKYFSDDILKNEMPSLLKNSKGKGIKLEFYKTEIEEALGLKEDGGLDQEQVAAEAADELGNYFVEGWRDAAIQEAIEINFKTENGGLEREQVERLNREAQEEEAKLRDIEEGMASPEIVEEELAKEEYRKEAEKAGYLQKVKPKAETISKFKESVDLFYKAKDTDGASKRRAILEQRREFLEKNPSFKYIDDNMKYIYKELEQKGIIERFGECP